MIARKAMRIGLTLFSGTAAYALYVVCFDVLNCVSGREDREA